MNKNLFILNLLLFVQNIQSKEILTIYSTDIGRVNAAGSDNIYHKFLQRIEKDLNVEFKIVFSPPSRSHDAFHKNQTSCLFPYAKDKLMPIHDDDMILSKSLGELELYAVTKITQPKITAKNIRTKKSFSIRSLYDKGVNFSDPNKKFWFVESQRQLYEMLEWQRVDYVLESIPDAYYTFPGGQAKYEQQYHFDHSFTAIVLNEHLVCQKNNPLANRVIEYVNRL